MVSTVFVYSIAGQLVAEYSDSPESRTSQTSYVSTDMLGSTRIVTGQDQTTKGRHDYLPFGEELQASVGPRATVPGYNQVDSIRQKFTEKERDVETGLDYFGARFYSSAHGRFTSPDPYAASADVGNPQSWNRYVYTLNNPLKYTDPEGLKETPVFLPYDKIHPEQRRILENSSITVGTGDNAQTLSGQALYDYYRNSTNEADQMALASFLTQTSMLLNIGGDVSEDGESPRIITALSFVESVTKIERDRIFVTNSRDLYTLISLMSNKEAMEGWLGIKTRYDSIGNNKQHPGFDTMFQEKVGEGSQQISFASNTGYTTADIDIDYYRGVWHLAEGAINSVFNRQTNPYEVYKQLQKRPDLAIKPNYTLVDKK